MFQTFYVGRAILKLKLHCLQWPKFVHFVKTLADPESPKYPSLIMCAPPSWVVLFDQSLISPRCPISPRIEMPNIIRLSATATLRLNPDKDITSSLPLKIKIKPKASFRALVGITNTADATPPSASRKDIRELPSSDRPSPSPQQSSRPIKRLPRLCPPGPFYHLGRVGKGTFGDAIAVRDLRFLGGSRGRVLCLKVFEKAKIKQARSEWVIVQELHAFQTLTASAGDRWFPFVMRMEASMEDTKSIIFAMVSPCQP